MSASRISESLPKILIIEDDRDHLELLSYVLNEYTVTLRLAQSALEGWKILQSETIALVIVDYFLPDLDGLSFIKRIRVASLRCRIVMLTSNHEHWLKEEARRCGVTHVIYKTAAENFLANFGDLVAQELGLRKKNRRHSVVGGHDCAAFLQSLVN